MLKYLLVLLLATFAGVSFAATNPPNVVVMLVDDLGATDLGCTGSTFYETPHLDQLAKDGMRFVQSYSACTVCSPTRASLLTGKSPAQLHLTDWIPGHENKPGSASRIGRSDSSQRKSPWPSDSRKPATRRAWSANGT